MKIGRFEASPSMRRRASVRAEGIDDVLDELCIAVDGVIERLVSETVPGRQVFECPRVVCEVLESLGQREGELDFLFLWQVVLPVQVEHEANVGIVPVAVLVHAGVGEMRLRVVRLLRHDLPIASSGLFKVALCLEQVGQQVLRLHQSGVVADDFPVALQRLLDLARLLVTLGQAHGRLDRAGVDCQRFSPQALRLRHTFRPGANQGEFAVRLGAPDLVGDQAAPGCLGIRQVTL
jgi:hypothetical protein